MSHQYEIEIGDYVDGTLPAPQAAALEAHLAACAECRALEADFRALRAAAATLEPHAPPPRVWARVAAELATRASARSRWTAWVPVSLAWRPAIAAGVIVALLASGTWFSWREVSGRARPPAVASAPDSTAQQSEGVEQQFRTQISSMEGIVRSGSPVLPGETRAAYQAGIDAIDTALDRPRAVLAAEPSNEVAQQSLFELLQSKLTLLQEMIALINEMRKGNQEEAARILSGMEQ